MSSNRQNPQRLVQEVMEEAETRSAGRTKVRVHDPTVRKRRQMGKQKKGHAHILQNELHLVFLNNVLHPPAGRSGRSQTPDTAGGRGYRRMKRRRLLQQNLTASGENSFQPIVLWAFLLLLSEIHHLWWNFHQADRGHSTFDTEEEKSKYGFKTPNWLISWTTTTVNFKTTFVRRRLCPNNNLISCERLLRNVRDVQKLLGQSGNRERKKSNSWKDCSGSHHVHTSVRARA